MGLWGERILPRLVDRPLSTDEVNTRRRLAGQGLQGRVLEIGVGSGLNLRFYPGAVSEVLAVEPSDLAWRLAQPRVERFGAPVRRAGLDGERLDLADGSVDTALSTYTRCTIPDVQAALLEVQRVLRPGGRCTSSSTAGHRSRRCNAGSVGSILCTAGWPRVPPGPSDRPADRRHRVHPDRH